MYVGVMILYTYKRHFPESLDVCSLWGTEFRGSIEVQDLILVITSAVSLYLGLSCVFLQKVLCLASSKMAEISQQNETFILSLRSYIFVLNENGLHSVSLSKCAQPRIHGEQICRLVLCGSLN